MWMMFIGIQCSAMIISLLFALVTMGWMRRKKTSKLLLQLRIPFLNQFHASIIIVEERRLKHILYGWNLSSIANMFKDHLLLYCLLAFITIS
ncbi:hypothetical protein ICE98_02303 [Lactococcus lactis]|nr:hypothetical protein [Lactococcus lactis]